MSPTRATPEPTGPMETVERVSAPESALSPQSPPSTDPKLKILLEAVGGRKMAAYLVSVIATSALALMGVATTEVLLSIQTALGVFVGGNAAEHKFSGRAQQ
jgi:hypothetical protein